MFLFNLLFVFCFSWVKRLLHLLTIELKQIRHTKLICVNETSGIRVVYLYDTT